MRTIPLILSLSTIFCGSVVFADTVTQFPFIGGKPQCEEHGPYQTVSRRVVSSQGGGILHGGYNPGSWNGELHWYPMDQGRVTGDALWKAEDVLDAQDDLDRNIAIYDPELGAAVPFRWSTLSESLQILLRRDPDTGETDSALIGIRNYRFLRGRGANLSSSKSSERDQSLWVSLSGVRHRDSKLGDIVSSVPIMVGAPGLRYPLESYHAFKDKHRERQPMVYVGANDGMLHAFNADTGQEVFAYIPGKVVPNLTRLVSPGYTHQAYVDGPITVGDAEIYGAWKTILIGTLGAGGQGLFALDVTDPENLNETALMWEFTDTGGDGYKGSQGSPDLGYTIGKPVISRLTNGQWVAILGNGPGSTHPDSTEGTGTARLLVINLESGKLIRTLDTGVGDQYSPNGLSTPNVIDLKGNMASSHAFAGDLHGNLWAFDLSDESPENWTVQQVFSSNKGRDQPISTQPLVTGHPVSGLLIHFGTGDSLASGEINRSAIALYDLVQTARLDDGVITVDEYLGITSVYQKHDARDYKKSEFYY